MLEKIENNSSLFIKVLRFFLLLLIIVGIFLIFTQKMWVPKLVDYILSFEPEKYKVITPEYVSDYKNISYQIEGQRIKLKNGYSEKEIVPGSASKIITKYFGNELKTDLNNDGKEDVVFLITQETGGSGVFYYVVSAIKTDDGYIGSDGYFLGDRIAPQNINNSQNPKHKNVIVVNYTERGPNDSMSTQPSFAKSAYLKLDDKNRWGLVMSDFEGESI